MLTKHGRQRAVERLGINEKRAIRFVENGIKKGISPEEMPKLEREFMLKKVKNNPGDKTVRYFAKFLMILGRNDELITIFEAPEWFLKTHYDGKEKIRNCKRYYKNNCWIEGGNKNGLYEMW